MANVWVILLVIENMDLPLDNTLPVSQLSTWEGEACTFRRSQAFLALMLGSSHISARPSRLLPKQSEVSPVPKDGHRRTPCATCLPRRISFGVGTVYSVSLFSLLALFPGVVRVAAELKLVQEVQSL